MANSRASEVIRVDTTAQFNGNLRIGSIKYVGNASGTAEMRADSSGGNLIWEDSGTANAYNSDVDIKAISGVHVTVTNSAVIYIYLR